MSNNIRSLTSRLKRLERKSGAGSANAFYDGLSDETLWAILQIPDDICEDADAQDHYFAHTLGIPLKKASALRANLDRFNAVTARECRHLSDEQLEAFVNAPFDSAAR